MELYLRQSCFGSCKIIHLIKTVPFSVLQPFLASLTLTSVIFTVVLYSGVFSDLSWCQTSLPFHFGGLDLREST